MIKHKSKRFKLLVIIIPVILLAIVAILYVFVIPRYDVSAESAIVQSSSTKDGVKHINATLKTDCNIAKEGDLLKCEQIVIKGTYGSNKQISVVVSGEVADMTVKDGRFSFTSKKIVLKSVAIRPEPINGQQSNKYEVIVKDKDGKNVLVYALTVDTIYTKNDLAIINKEPVADEIRVAIERLTTAKDVCIANENNDPNGKLGKPGTYFIKVVFVDTRAPAKNEVFDESINSLRPAKDSCEKGADAGGSVEVFKSAKDANSRKQELDGLAGGFFDSGTSRVVNTSVVRTSSELKASEQKDLEQQLVDVLTK